MKDYNSNSPISFNLNVTVKDILLLIFLTYNAYNSYMQKIVLEEKLNSYKAIIVEHKANIIDEFDKRSSSIIDRVSKIESFVGDKLDRKAEQTNNVIQLMSEKVNNKIANANLDTFFRLSEQKTVQANSTWSPIIEWVPAILGTVLVIWLVYLGYNKYNEIINIFYPYLDKDNYIKGINSWIDFFNKKPKGDGGGAGGSNSLMGGFKEDECPVYRIYGEQEMQTGILPKDITRIAVNFSELIPEKPPRDVQELLRNSDHKEIDFSTLSEEAQKARMEALAIIEQSFKGGEIIKSTGSAAAEASSTTTSAADVFL